MGRFLAFILGVAGAVIASQGPGFTLQYMQNLQGRVDELNRIIVEEEEGFSEFGYDRDSAMVECREASNLLEAMCANYRTMVTRYEYLTAHLDKLNAADAYARPLILARGYDRDIVDSVREQFEPAVPATVDGAIYAAGGFAVVWGFASLIFGLLGAMFGAGRR